MRQSIRSWRGIREAACLAGCLALGLLTGCGGNASVAKVSGKVQYNGQPVTGGTLMFLPVPKEGSSEAGVPGVAAVESTGTYTVSTSGNQDGAVVGRHRVVYTPPGPPPKPPGDTTVEKLPFDNLVPKTSEVEVKPGTNEIEIELIPNPAAPMQ
jgi:hypothetical protein